jgi:hypothetical protein
VERKISLQDIRDKDVLAMAHPDVTQRLEMQLADPPLSLQMWLSLGPLQLCLWQKINRSLTLPSWFQWLESEVHPLHPVLQYCPWEEPTWTAVVTSNPSCIEPGNSLFLQFSASPSPFPSSSG